MIKYTIKEGCYSALVPVWDADLMREVDKVILFDGQVLLLSEFTSISATELSLKHMGNKFKECDNGTIYVIREHYPVQDVFIVKVEVSIYLSPSVQQRFSRFTL